MVHFRKDTLKSRKWLWLVCSACFAMGYLWMIFVPWIWGPTFFGECFDFWHAYEDEYPLMAVVISMASLIFVFQIHCVCCLKNYHDVLANGKDIPGHMWRRGPASSQLTILMGQSVSSTASQSLFVDSQE
jgi:predicted AlkP superfamily pyrophosphatase or phosphodiesterase